jgi:hypothetical protein
MSRVSRVDLNQIYDIFQTLQCTDNDGAVSPWTDIVDVQHISALLDGEAFGRNAMAEVGSHLIPLTTGIDKIVVLRLSEMPVSIREVATSAA